MTSRRVIALCASLAAVSACGPIRYGRQRYSARYVQPGYTYLPAYRASPPPQSSLLYVPLPRLTPAMVQAIEIHSQDGRVFPVQLADVQASYEGHLAIALPAGVTAGTIVITAAGQTFTVPFQVPGASAGGGPLIQPAPGPEAGSACAVIAGRWVGSVTSVPGSSATFDLEPMPDCRSVRGLVHVEAPTVGSVDATIEGTWDADAYRLVLRDAQLFNEMLEPGSGAFCVTERYDLSLEPDGTLQGHNYTSGAGCPGMSQVYLRRP